MGNAVGVEIRSAFKRASEWGAPVQCGAGDGVLMLPHTLKKERGSNIDDSLGLYFPEEADPSEIKVEGDIPAYLRYDGLDMLIALSMGSTAGVPVQQGGSGAYAQSIMLKEDNDGLFGTFALDNGVNIDEYVSVKLSGFTLRGEVGKPVEIAFHSIASDRLCGSTVNTQASFSDVTCFETGNRVLMGQGAFMMNDRDDIALGQGSEIYPSAFELVFKRKLRGVYGISSTLDTIDEPVNDGPPDIRLKLTFPRYTSKSNFDDWDSGIAKKLDVTFTGADIESPYKRLFKLSFPNLRLVNVELPVERGILKHPLDFVCLSTSAAPEGMAGITRPFQVDIVNRQPLDMLS